jgi:phosphoglycerate dehydrogenase-like enzyme
VTPAAGQDYFHAPVRVGLTVEYSSFHGPLIAETVAGVLLGHLRGLFRAERLRLVAPWPRAELARAMRTLRSLTVGILGHGHIGRAIGQTLGALGARVIGFRRSTPSVSADGDRTQVRSVEELDRILPTLDALVLALPRDTTTDGIIGAKRLVLLRSSAVLVNVGRGNAIDEASLEHALRKGELAAAFLDVFREEPLPAESPLRACENAFLFPHTSAIAPEYLDLFIAELVRKYRERYDEEPAGGNLS